MLYQYVKRYLKNSLKEPKSNFKWSSIDDIKFFNYIKQRYTNEEFSKEISEVKVAFKDFFAPVGNIVFRFKEESGIKFVIFPYKVKPQSSKHLKKIIKIIQTNKRDIVYPYQGQNDQIAIFGKIRREINREIADTQESINAKDLIEYAIRTALELGEKDILTQLKRKYIIKIFNKNNVLDIEKEIVAPSQREGKLNRYNGYTEQQIEETYKDIFQKGNANIDYFLKATMDKIFEKELDFRRIDNKFYEIKSLKVIHHAIAKELSDYIELEYDYLLGISGYLMRKHFYTIHELMAKELIKRIYEKDANAHNFLLFYNGKTILIDNQKYIIPSLESEDGRQWNSSSLIGICNLWMNTKERKESYEQKLIETEVRLEEVKNKLSHIEPEKELQEKLITQTLEQVEVLSQQDKELKMKLHYFETTMLNSSEYFNMKKKLDLLNVKLQKSLKILQDAKFKLKTIKDNNSNIYADLEFLNEQKINLLHDIKAQNLNIDSKNIQIDPIIQSIIKVLMNRTKLLTSDS